MRSTEWHSSLLLFVLMMRLTAMNKDAEAESS